MSRLAFAAIVMAATLPALAQQGRGSYFGTVTDTTGAAVPAAKVTLTNVATNTSVTTETNNDGTYSATALQIGEYTISVEKSGFKRAVRSGLTLQVDQRGQGPLGGEGVEGGVVGAVVGGGMLVASAGYSK